VLLVPTHIKASPIHGLGLFAGPEAARHMGPIREASGRAEIIGTADTAGIDALERAKRPTLRLGQTVEIARGPLAGFPVTIAAIHGREISVLIGAATWRIPKDDATPG
jgi:transcription antitermination factor NusG